MADTHPQPDDSLSDGLLLLRGDARYRAELGLSDDRDDVYLLHEVGRPDATPVARAVVRREGEHALLSDVDGSPVLARRLVAEICHELRADGATSLSAGPDLPDSAAFVAGVTHTIAL